MGWNGGLIFGMFYWLVPKIFKTNLFSKKMANTHFWIATLGILLFAIPLYWAGITQWLMLREYTAEGLLACPNFLETSEQIAPMYVFRIFGGLLYFAGILLFMVNLVKTMKAGKLASNEPAEAPALVNTEKRSVANETFHRWLERKSVRFALLVFVALVIGGVVEIVPMLKVESNVPKIETVMPYSPLELAGRDVYIANGCYNCHSQQVRPLRWETERYGEYSKIGEFVYDHPFQWGSRRTGPDLARAGYIGSSTYKSAVWHYSHFVNPTEMNPQTIMPAYPWLAKKDVKMDLIPKKISVMKKLGVPYAEGFEDLAVDNYMKEAQAIVEELKQSGIEVEPTKEIVAMIAYLHKLGRDISK
jgi:cytochrome c oxidase cbb3-type subunit I/II